MLSDLGHQQSRGVGAVLCELEWSPDRLETGTLNRQGDKLSSIGFDQPSEEHSGFNDYDFADLLSARFKGNLPDLVKGDCKTHFPYTNSTLHPIFVTHAGARQQSDS